MRMDDLANCTMLGQTGKFVAAEDREIVMYPEPTDNILRSLLRSYFFINIVTSIHPILRAPTLFLYKDTSHSLEELFGYLIERRSA